MKEAGPILIESNERNDSHTEEIMQISVSTIPLFTPKEQIWHPLQNESTNKQRVTGSHP